MITFTRRRPLSCLQVRGLWLPVSAASIAQLAHEETPHGGAVPLHLPALRQALREAHQRQVPPAEEPPRAAGLLKRTAYLNAPQGAPMGNESPQDHNIPSLPDHPPWCRQTKHRGVDWMMGIVGGHGPQMNRWSGWTEVQNKACRTKVPPERRKLLGDGDWGRSPKSEDHPWCRPNAACGERQCWKIFFFFFFYRWLKPTYKRLSMVCQASPRWAQWIQLWGLTANQNAFHVVARQLNRFTWSREVSGSNPACVRASDG